MQYCVHFAEIPCNFEFSIENGSVLFPFIFQLSLSFLFIITLSYLLIIDMSTISHVGWLKPVG